MCQKGNEKVEQMVQGKRIFWSLNDVLTYGEFQMNVEDSLIVVIVFVVFLSFSRVVMFESWHSRRPVIILMK